MNQLARRMVLAAAGLGFAVAAHAQSTVIIAPAAPPAPRVETVPPPPATIDSWIPGHWTWTGANWAWTPGEYVARPAPQAAWVPGYWEQQPTGYVWVAGHWAG